MSSPDAAIEQGAAQALQPTLPGRHYYDPELFEREQEVIFERDWCCAIRAADLRKPGAFQTVRIGREAILLTRGRDGVIRAFLNVCRHRGSLLVADDRGEVRRNFRCAYHSWAYSMEGALVAAPNMAAMSADDRASRGLHSLAVTEWAGYVWVCLADEPPPFAATVAEQVAGRLGDLAAFDRYGIADLVVGRRIRYDVAANWKLIVENFMECYHCATIHPELVRVLPEFAKGYAAQYFVGHGAEFADGVAGFTIDGSAGQAPIPGLSPEQDRRYFAVTIRPQVFINLVPDHVIWHRMFPVAADRTIVECDWLFTADAVAASDELDRSVELFHRVNEQDFAACEACQPNMRSRLYADGGVLVPSEHHIVDFHRWITMRCS